MSAKELARNFTENERNVLEMLREHPRSIETIAWGLLTTLGIGLTEPDVLIALEGLEKKGLAKVSPVSTVNKFWVKSSTHNRELCSVSETDKNLEQTAQV